jgi:hypothetical protein
VTREQAIAVLEHAKNLLVADAYTSR